MKTSYDNHKLPFLLRPDLSPFIIHLTKRNDERTAFKNLVRILREGRIDGTRSYVKGPSSAACFMDVPFSALKYVLTDENAMRYEPFGVVVSKSYAYQHDCRPVCYLSDEEIKDMEVPTTQLWRVVRFDGVGKHDAGWSHEREWRVKDGFNLPGRVRAVLVKNTKYAEALRKLIEKTPDSFASTPLSIMPLSVLCQGLPGQ